MDWIVLEGVPPYDGRYEFDLSDRPLTTREWGFIKRLSGYLPLTMEEGFDGGDPELFASFAAIALHRAGKIGTKDVPAVFEQIADAPFGSVVRTESDTSEEEIESSPPPSSSNGSDGTSGTSSSRSSDPSEQHPSPTGTPGSDSSPSAPPTLVT